jgi:ribosome biogenesis protein MAK21
MLVIANLFVTPLFVCLFNLETLTELFLSDLLRPDGKLREFEKCPLSLLDKYSSGNHMSRKSRLIHWYFEDQLKKLYHSFVLALNTAAQDSVERNKEKAITAMYKLLAGNPEQEAVCIAAFHRPVSCITIMLDIFHYLIYY